MHVSFFNPIVSLLTSSVQWQIQGVSRFPRKPPFEIDLNRVNLNTLIEQSDQKAIITAAFVE